MYSVFIVKNIVALFASFVPQGLRVWYDVCGERGFTLRKALMHVRERRNKSLKNFYIPFRHTVMNRFGGFFINNNSMPMIK